MPATRAKRSPIWKMPRDQFVEIVKSCTSVGEVLKHFGLKNQGGNNRTVYTRIAHEGIDLPSGAYTRGLNNTAGKRFIGTRPSVLRVPQDRLFVENSPHTRTVVRKRILQDRLLPYVCAVCGNSALWLGRTLSLVLDHINGKANDHRLENLRFLCPNCNSQTDTFAGRNNNGKQGRLPV